MADGLTFTMTPAMVTSAHVTMPCDCAAPVSFAAQELARYLAALVSVPAASVIENRQLPGTVVLLGEDAGLVDRAVVASRGLANDGYAVIVRQSGIAIAGMNPRGTLYGVYGLLHELGFRWLTPGDDGEMIPSLDEIRLPVGTRASAPAFRRRGFGEDTRAVPLDDDGWFSDLVSDTRQFVDWMAKNRLSHLTTTATPLAGVPSLQDDLDQRGIVSTYGSGHNLPRLLPRELFANHPDYFRMDAGGQRRPDGNLCVSNADAVRIVVANAVDEVRKNQPVEIYSVQGEDTPEGTWCACPDCRTLSALQQNLVLCRAVEDGLRSAGMPDTRVALAAYQSTIEPDIDPADLPDRLFVHFAPRDRSYAEPVDGPANHDLARQLAGWASLLGDDSLAVIEYYTDAVRFASLPVPLTRVIAADLRAYRDAGAIAWLRVLFMSRYCWWAYRLNMYVVARLAWNTDEPVEEIVADYCRHRYGTAGTAMIEFFDRFEQAMANVVATTAIDGVSTAPEQWLSSVELAFARLADGYESGERALSICDDESARRHVRQDLLASCFSLYRLAALGNQLRGQDRNLIPKRAEIELMIALDRNRAAVEMLRTDPDAPRSAWLDSDLGIHQQSEALIGRLKQALAEVRSR